MILSGSVARINYSAFPKVQEVTEAKVASLFSFSEFPFLVEHHDPAQAITQSLIAFLRSSQPSFRITVQHEIFEKAAIHGTVNITTLEMLQV